MALVGDTGNTATVTFGTSAFAGKCRVIGELEQIRQKLKVSHLATAVFEEYIPGDLREPGEFEMEIIFDAGIALPDNAAAAETITITFPLLAGDTTEADVVGTGFITTRTLPKLANNEVQIAKCKVAFDGDTGPTFTPGS